MAYINQSYLISALGVGPEENFMAFENNVCGISSAQLNPELAEKISLAAINRERINAIFKPGSEEHEASFLEKLMACCVDETIKNTTELIQSSKTLVLISTTKGNIDLLNNHKATEKSRIELPALGKFIEQRYHTAHTPVIVSNACISGLLAIIIGSRLIDAGEFENVLVIGGDIISPFVTSGFMSLKAVSPNPCRPFDASRDGLSLGEGCGSVLLSKYKTSDSVEVSGGGSANDANHISGPSRDGEGLYLSINEALRNAKLNATDIAYISAHGTATPYNDEMESHAFTRCGLNQVPINSFKGYWGHTLGAAGLIESVVAIHSLQTGRVFKSLGCENPGVSNPLNIVMENSLFSGNHILKTTSGFGGCNAAAIFSKIGR